MRISDWSSDVCSSDLVGMTGFEAASARQKNVLSHFAGRLYPLAMAQNVTPRRPRKNAHISGDFDIPEITTELRQRIGSSPIDEFVLAHGAADVFRELIQNEFDADGSEIGIRFPRNQLAIPGKIERAACRERGCQ